MFFEYSVNALNMVTLAMQVSDNRLDDEFDVFIISVPLPPMTQRRR